MKIRFSILLFTILLPITTMGEKIFSNHYTVETRVDEHELSRWFARNVFFQIDTK